MKPQSTSPSWIEHFLASTSLLNSPSIYRKWVSLATISSALQRKVHTTLNGTQIFPNLFVLLVGPPGLGKTLAINPGKNVLSKLPNIAISPARMSNEKFIQLLSKCTRMSPIPNNPYFSQSAYAAFLSEISTFIRPGDTEFMTILTDLFDCPKTWTYSTLSRDNDKIENLFLTLIGGITPKALAENFGSAAFGMGFTSRLNIIYSEDYIAPQLFATRKTVDFSALAPDLERIHNISGEYTFAPEVEKTFQAWIDTGMHPKPTDGRLAEYIPRRWLHLSKLCMIYAAAESSSLTIEISHYEKAKTALLEAEAVMPKALVFVGTNPFREAIHNIQSWLLAEFEKTGKAVTEADLKKKLLTDVSPQYLNPMIVELVQSGMVALTENGGQRLYLPKASK